MLFFSDKLEKNAPRIEEKLRKELRLPTPLPFEVEVEGSFRPGSVGQLLGDLGQDLSLALVGVGGMRTLYTLRFDVAVPRPVEIRVPVLTGGNRIVLGGLLYTTTLGCSVSGQMSLEPPEDAGLFGGCKFTGDPTLAAKFNANKPVLKLVNKFVRDSYMVGETEIEVSRFFKLSPAGQRSVLSIQTVPRSTWFGMGSSFDAAEFIQIASLIESTLR